jgi:hypothetical protein
MKSRRAPACARRALASLVVLGVSAVGVPAAATTTRRIAAAPAPSPPSFTALRSYRAGGDPRSVAIGDLNGDARPDLAVANDHGVSVLANRGDGTFRAARNFTTGSELDQWGAVAIGKLTGDAKPDLAVANFPFRRRGRILLLTNRGRDTFRAERRLLTNPGPEAIGISDLNGDKKPDLVAVSHDADAVSVFLKTGEARFATKVDYRTGAGPGSIAIGDLTGDRAPDLVTTNGNADSISLLVNKGDGTFEPKRGFRARRNPTDVAIGDLNADGKPDVAAVNNWSGSISVFTNSGGGKLEPRRNFPTARGPDAVKIADLNGDRRPDLANLNGGRNSISILLNGGDGTFESRLEYAAGGNPAALASGDLNRDGKVDLVTAYDDSEDGIGVLLARPGLCTVQDVRSVTVDVAKGMLARANCRLGKIRRVHSSLLKSGLILSQKPRPGAVLGKFGRVDVRVSRGPGR